MTDPVQPEPRPSVVGDDLGLGLRVPGRGTVDAEGRRRVHPVSPIVHGVQVIPVVFILVIVLSGAGALKFGVLGIAGALVLALVVAGLVAGWKYLVWRNTWFWFDADGDFRVDSGVLQKQQRRLQLSRLQTVDVAQPLFARVFAMAEVRVEVAGSTDSRVTLQFLPLDEARDLRSEILARAAGLRHDSGEAPEAPIVTVPPQQLALALVIRSSTIFLLLFSVALLLFTFLTGGWGGLLVALVTGGVPILIVVSEFIKYFNFTVTQSPDGLRQRFGLAKTETRTVPPGRVQAIEFVEPLLWRRRGWVRVRVNIAGVGHVDSNGNREETLLIPVATHEVAADLVERVLPGLDLDSLVWHAAPRTSRWRAPIQWERLAVGWDAAVFAARSGRITRRLAVIPHARTQSVRLTQGPWERALGLASVHVDSTPGPVSVTGRNLEAMVAREVVDDQAERAEAARAADTSIRWGRQADGDVPQG